MIISNRFVPTVLNLTINNQVIERVENHNFLGVLIDAKLTFKKHIDKICGKISRGLGIMYRLKDLLNDSVLANVYYALIHSHLCYGILAWGGAAPSNLARLKSLQRRAVKMCSSYHDSSSLHYRVLSLENLYKYFCCIKIYKSINLDYDPNFAAHLIGLQPSHSYSTRHRENNNLNVPFFH